MFSRRPRRTNVPRLKPRRESVAQVDRVDLAELTPELLPYLGQAAYVQLALFETLSRAVNVAPTAASKVAVSRVAALALAKHHGLAAEIKRLGHEPGPAMAPFAARIDEYARVTLGADWYEMLVTAYLTAGLLGDFQRQLASGLNADARARIIPLLSGDDGHALLIDELRSAIDANPRLASRLGMWGIHRAHLRTHASDGCSWPDRLRVPFVGGWRGALRAISNTRSGFQRSGFQPSGFQRIGRATARPVRVGRSVRGSRDGRGTD